MKICHMTSAHDSDDIRILKKQCVSLAKKQDNEVYLVAKGEDFNFKNVHIVGIGEQQGGRLNRILKVGKTVYEKALSLDADIYQFHDPELMMYAKKLKKHGKIVIFDSHENYREQIMQKGYIPKPLRRIIQWIYCKVEKHACKYIDAALFPSEKNPYEGMVAECVAIYNSPMPDELKITTPIEKKQPSVCCVGTLSEIRGIKVLVEACYKAGVKLVLGGVFSPAEFGDELKNSRYFANVDYRGFCDREQVNAIYNECMIGADNILRVGQYPFLQNLSTKAYEYMMMKMPYITSDFDYNKKIVDEYKCAIYVDPSDADAIAEAIKYLVNNPEIAKSIGENGKKLVDEKYSWSNDEKRLYDLYGKLYLNLKE